MTTAEVRLNRVARAKRAALAGAADGAARAELFRWYKRHNASIRKRRRAFKASAEK